MCIYIYIYIYVDNWSSIYSHHISISHIWLVYLVASFDSSRPVGVWLKQGGSVPGSGRLEIPWGFFGIGFRDLPGSPMEKRPEEQIVDSLGGRSTTLLGTDRMKYLRNMNRRVQSAGWERRWTRSQEGVIFFLPDVVSSAQCTCLFSIIAWWFTTWHWDDSGISLQDGMTFIICPAEPSREKNTKTVVIIQGSVAIGGRPFSSPQNKRQNHFIRAPDVVFFQDLTNRPLEHTPNPQPTVYEGIPFIWGFWGCLGYAPGVCWVSLRFFPPKMVSFTSLWEPRSFSLIETCPGDPVSPSRMPLKRDLPPCFDTSFQGLKTGVSDKPWNLKDS